MTDQQATSRDKYFTKAEEIRNAWRAAFEARTLSPDSGMAFSITTPTRSPHTVLNGIEGHSKEWSDLVQLCLKGLSGSDSSSDVTPSNQAVVFSGVTHSGKTANHRCCLLDFLINHATFQNQDIKKKLCDAFPQVVFPLLDLFLGAPTCDNLESSCCTSVVSILFEPNDSAMVVKSCKLSIMYPELQRIVSNKDESFGGNFNVFYAIARHNEADVTTKYKFLGDLDPYSGQDDPQPNRPTFNSVLSALVALGLPQDQVEEIVVILNAILLLGNTDFVSIPTGTSVSKESRPALTAICKLLGITNETAFEECLCKNTILDLRTDVPVVEAQTKRDSLAKALYQCVLQFLILRMNSKLGGRSDDDGEDGEGSLPCIHLVDMAALPLEMDNVGLRHILITHSYEKLQWMYCKDIVQSFRQLHAVSQPDARSESLPLVFQYSVDENTTITDLIESRDPKTPGLFSLLSDKAVCDSLLYNRLHRFHNERKDIGFSSKKETFSIRYPFLKLTAMYRINGFQRYNTSALSNETIDLLRTACTCQIVVHGTKQCFLTSQERTDAKNPRLPSSCSSYIDDCADLFRMISSATRHYVRCFRLVNNRVSANGEAPTVRQFDRQGVFEQIKVHGLPYTETFNFSMTLKFEDIVEMAQKYDPLLLSSVEYCQAGSLREKVQVILNSFWLDSDYLLESMYVHFTFKNKYQLQRAVRRRRNVSAMSEEGSENVPSSSTDTPIEMDDISEDDKAIVNSHQDSPEEASKEQEQAIMSSAEPSAEETERPAENVVAETKEMNTIAPLTALSAGPAAEAPSKSSENETAPQAPTNVHSSTIHATEADKQAQVQFRAMLARAGASMTIAAISGNFLLTREFAAKLLRIQNQYTITSVSVEDIHKAICELETLCRYIPENYDGLNGPKSMRIPVEKAEFEDNQTGGRFTEASRLYSLTDSMMEGSYSSRVSEGEAKEFLMLARGQLYHYFHTPPHYKRKYLVMRVLRAMDTLIVRNLERINFVLEIINFTRLQGLFDLLIELLSSHDTHATMVFLITRVLANVVSSFDNTHVWFSTGHGLKGFLANITWTFEEMRVRDSPNDFYIIFFVLKTLYHLTRTGSLQKALSDSKIYQQEKLPHLLLNIIRAFPESAMRCLVVRLTANIACIYSQEFQQLGIAWQFIKLIIETLDRQLMKYTITALIAMVNDEAAVEEHLDAVCNVVVLSLLDVFEQDAKYFKRNVKNLAQLTLANGECKDMARRVFGDNLMQALDDFNLFYKHDAPKCDAILLKFSHYKDSLLADPDCDRRRMDIVAECKDNLTRFGLHWKSPLPAIDRTTNWSPAMPSSARSTTFDQSPFRAADMMSYSPRSPESGRTTPRVIGDNAGLSRRRLNFIAEEESESQADHSHAAYLGANRPEEAPKPQPDSIKRRAGQQTIIETLSPPRKAPPPPPPSRMASERPTPIKLTSSQRVPTTRVDDIV